MEICVWQPKYQTSQVLVDMRKVKPGKNYIFFSSDKSFPYLYSFTSEEAEQCSKIYNGKILCYGIPMSYLRCEGELPERLWAKRDAENEKYQAYAKKWRKKA